MSTNAIGNWSANGARALAIAGAIVMTLRYTKPARLFAAADGR